LTFGLAIFRAFLEALSTSLVAVEVGKEFDGGRIVRINIFDVLLTRKEVHLLGREHWLGVYLLVKLNECWYLLGCRIPLSLS
jgi:hypothetical protein